MALLRSIDQSSAVLVNDLQLVLWSLPKTYLRDLESRGAAIIPSLWFEHMSTGCLDHTFQKFAVDKIIVKPVVSTNATDTFLLMELELVEPSMYLRMDSRAPAQFAEAFDRYVLQKSGSNIS